MDSFPATRSSLLLRVRDGDDTLAWGEFVELYTPLVYKYARRHGLQDADAADLAQEVLRTCSQYLGRFDYDRARGTFRGWLYSVVRTRLSNLVAGQKRHPKGQGGTDFMQVLEQQPSPESDADRWDHDYEFRIIEWAQDRIRCEFRERTWQAYLRTAHSGESPKTVARSLGMSVGAVYVSKARVLKRLKQRVAEIEDDPSWFIN
jgi:RNA polymerase sigma-70 factor (ECF subfamily)